MLSRGDPVVSSISNYRLSSAAQLSLGLCGQAASLICAARLFILASLDSEPQLNSGYYTAAAATLLLGFAFSGVYTGAGVASVIAEKFRLLNHPRWQRRNRRALLRLVLLNGMALPCALVQAALSLPALLRGLAGTEGGHLRRTLAFMAAGFGLNLAYCACVATLACRQLCAAFRNDDCEVEGQPEAEAAR